MAGHARYTVVLDACVLYSIVMTDALLSLATAGLFAAKWTTRIEQECAGCWPRKASTNPDSAAVSASGAGVAHYRLPVGRPRPGR